MTTRIYTKTGDTGQTGLFGGDRVSKANRRVDAYGEVDSLNATLGWARSVGASDSIDGILLKVQSLLFELGAQLASPGQKSVGGTTPEDIAWLETCIDEAEAELPALKTFILPGGHPAAAALHMARTQCRQSERRVVALQEAEPETGSGAVVFLNRLADLLFVLARLRNKREGVEDVAWQARPKS